MTGKKPTKERVQSNPSRPVICGGLNNQTKLEIKWSLRRKIDKLTGWEGLLCARLNI